MKYTVDKGKQGIQNILILTEKSVPTAEGRIIESKLGNQSTAERYDVILEYETFKGNEEIVNLVVCNIKDGKDRKTVIIDNMSLSILNLVRVNEDILPYIINKLNSTYNGCPRALFEEISDDYDIEIQSGRKEELLDYKALKVIEDLLSEDNCRICKLGYSWYPAGEVITAPLKLMQN